MFKKFVTAGIVPLALASTVATMAVPAAAQLQYQQKIAHSAARCNGSNGPAVSITISGIRETRGTLRVQSYRGVESDWLRKGRWLNRIELPARAGQMVVCMPVPESGTYAIAVRHDLNQNGETDLREDGGGMSNNPPINIFNLGRPSYKRTAFVVNGGVTSIAINMRYM